MENTTRNQSETDTYKQFLNKYVTVTTKQGNHLAGTLKSYVQSDYLLLESTGSPAELNNESIDILSNFLYLVNETNVASITVLNPPKQKYELCYKKGNLPPLKENNQAFKVTNQGYKAIFEETNLTPP